MEPASPPLGSLRLVALGPWFAVLTLATVAALLLLPTRGHAQALTLVNPSFEFSNTFIGGSSTETIVNDSTIPGWLVRVPQGGFAGVSSDQNPPNKDGDRFAYLFSGGPGAYETRPADRPAVTPGDTFVLTALARADDTNVVISVTMGLQFFDSFGSLLSTAGMNYNVTGRVSGSGADTPFNTLVGAPTVVPTNAATVGISFAAANTVILDDFEITAVPEPATWAAACGALALAAGALRRRRRNRQPFCRQTVSVEASAPTVAPC